MSKRLLTEHCHINTIATLIINNQTMFDKEISISTKKGYIIMSHFINFQIKKKKINENFPNQSINIIT